MRNSKHARQRDLKNLTGIPVGKDELGVLKEYKKVQKHASSDIKIRIVREVEDRQGIACRSGQESG